MRTWEGIKICENEDMQNLLGIKSRSSILNWIYKHNIPTLKMGKKYVCPYEAVAEVITGKKKGGC